MWHAGGPCGARLEALGLRTFDNASGLEEGCDPQVSASQPLAAVGPGFPAVSKKLVARIRANEYVDFAELPPAKGKNRPVTQAMEGQVLVVQAADLLQSRKVIPDLATWSQCFALYVAILAPAQPERVQDLMAYQAIIAKASSKYRWPSWVVYDQNFRLEVAGNPDQPWAKVDPSIYALSFTGQTISVENWCSRCQCLDHTTSNCPAAPARKRPWHSAQGSPAPPAQRWSGSQDHPAQRWSGSQEHQVCLKYNRFGGDCKFGKQCKFRHVCSSCGDPHPVSKCKEGAKKSDPSASGQ